GAYILETSCGLSSYLDLYQQRRADLLNQRGQFFSGHPASVTTTFSLLFEKVEKVNLVAPDLLRVCAYLYPEAIPEEIISKGAFHLGPHLKRIMTDSLVLDEAMGMLHTYSLVNRNVDTKTF